MLAGIAMTIPWSSSKLTVAPYASEKSENSRVVCAWEQFGTHLPGIEQQPAIAQGERDISQISICVSPEVWVYRSRINLAQGDGSGGGRGERRDCRIEVGRLIMDHREQR